MLLTLVLTLSLTLLLLTLPLTLSQRKSFQHSLTNSLTYRELASEAVSRRVSRRVSRPERFEKTTREHLSQFIGFMRNPKKPKQPTTRKCIWFVTKPFPVVLVFLVLLVFLVPYNVFEAFCINHCKTQCV